jgi:tubulin--tyrosine ligase-like protein 12
LVRVEGFILTTKAEYQRREEKKEGNYWIIKPWNKARSIDTIISNNLDCLVRMSETGPKVACKCTSIKYHLLQDLDIERPITYNGRKFDLRYIVLLKSIAPLELYVYNMFWIRLANIQYSLEDFEEYEKHFTVCFFLWFLTCLGNELQQALDDTIALQGLYQRN